MIILGIDPGSRYTGWGVIRFVQGELRCLAAGRICLGDRAHGERLVLIYDGIHSIVSQYQPSVVAIESVFVNKNVQSALKLGQARGVALVACAKSGLEPIEISPRLVKKTVAGYGAMGKTGVAEMVKRLLRVEEDLSVDASDALAIAIAASAMQRSQI